MHRSASIIVPVAAALVLPNCLVTSYKDTHCSNQDGDAFCRRAHPDLSLPYCSYRCEHGVVDGCVAEEPEPDCYSPCGDGRSIEDDPACEPVPVPDDTTGTDTGTGSGSGSDSGESGSSTTGPLPCMSDDDCMSDAAPFCEPGLGECVACDQMPDPGGACAGLDPNEPLCVDGACVACTAEDTSVCYAQALVCDEETNACVPCTEHEQCESGACDAFMGECIDVANVLHVGFMQEFGTVGAALDEVMAMSIDPAVLVLHGGPSFDETAEVTTGVVAFVAAEGDSPQWINSGVAAPTLTVSGAQTRVYVQGIRLAQNGNDLGLLVDAEARVDVRRSRIVQNSGGGIVAQNAAELTLRNCFVGDGNTNSTDAITITGAALDMLYTTVGAAANTGMPARALFCDAGGQADVRNSVLVSFDAGPEVECPGLTIADSATEAELGMLSGTWFTNYGTGDFHLTMSAPIPFATSARWQTGDPATDIDGDPRPTMDGAVDYAGADAVP